MARRREIGVATRRLTGDWPEGPWLLLLSTALAAPFAVLGQGGEWHTAVLAALACLATPGAAIEAMLGLGRLAARIEGGGR
jgi:hypothetical protein